MKILEVMKQVEEFIIGKKEEKEDGMYPWHNKEEEVVKPKRKYRRRRAKKS